MLKKNNEFINIFRKQKKKLIFFRKKSKYDKNSKKIYNHWIKEKRNSFLAIETCFYEEKG